MRQTGCENPHIENQPAQGTGQGVVFCYCGNARSGPVERLVGCGHEYHEDCYVLWVYGDPEQNTGCLLCRFPFV